MAQTNSTYIPAFYRYYFRWSDPIICLWATYMDFFTPAFAVAAFVPESVAPWNPYFDFCIQQLGGSLIMLAFIDAVLLRYTLDVNIWKIIQAAVLIYDCVMLYSNYYALDQQGRLSIDKMRWEHWGCFVITVQAALVRTAFLLGVGLSEDRKVTKKA